MLRALALASTLLVAGCLSASPDLETATAPALPGWEAAHAALAAAVADVPCEATAVTEETSDNLREVALATHDGSTHGEIDVRGDWMLVARYQNGGFEMVNVADPANPALAATYSSEEESALDVKWMPDNRSAVIGHFDTVELVDLSPVLDSGLAPAEIAARGILPVTVSEWTYTGPGLFGANMHMLYTKRIGDVDYVFVAPNDNTGVWILKLADGKLETVASGVGEPLGGGYIGPHDMTVLDDAILGVPVLWVANGFEGWQAWDVSDPASPAQLAVMPNLDPGQGYTHTIMAEKIGERRIVVTISEVGVNVVKIFDATDLATPILLGEWWAEKTDPTHPNHNIQLLNGTLYVAYYTHGVYVFDLTALGSLPLADTATLAPIAHYAPAEPSAGGPLAFDDVWDVVVHRGLLYVNDQARGTSVVAFGCLAPGDAAATSAG